FRNLELNLSDQSASLAMRLPPVGERVPPLVPGKNINWLLRRSLECLQQLNPEFTRGYVSVCLYPTFYPELPLKDHDKFGHEVGFRWWAWGDTEKETMAHFKQVVATMFEC